MTRRRMRRIADARCVVAAIRAADRVSIDLLFAVPDASGSTALCSLDGTFYRSGRVFWWSGAARERRLAVL